MQIPKDLIKYLATSYEENEIVKKRYLNWLLLSEMDFSNLSEKEKTEALINLTVPELNLKIPFDEVEETTHQFDEW